MKRNWEGRKEKTRHWGCRAMMKEKNNLMDKLSELKSKSATDLWLEDLKEFETNYKKLFK